jgi:hypothetical protein
MTYFLPQTAATPTPVLVPPGAPQTPNATLIQSTTSANPHHNPSTNSNSAGRRSSPPSNNHHHHSSNNNNRSSTPAGSSIHTTAVPLQTFSSSVPLSLATSDNGPGSGPQALYAIPPSVYPNVLPYAGAPTAGFYQPLPHHPPTNTTIISSVIPHTNAHPTGTLPSTPHSFQSNAGHVPAGEVVTHFPFNQSTQNSHNNNNNPTSTPQSAPSTPLSLTTVQPSFKNPPLFATPPILATTSIPAPVHIAHYDGGEKKTYGGGGYVPKKYNNNGNGNGNGILNTPPLSQNVTKPSSNANQRQTVGGYQGSTVSAQGGGKKTNVNYSGNNINNNSSTNINSHTHSEDTNSLSNSTSNYTSNRLKNSSNRDQTSAPSASGGGGGSYQPKSTYVPKGQHQQHQSYNNSANNNGSNSNSPNSNDNSEGSKYVPQQQQQHRGPARAVPPSLDLKRNNSSSSNTTVMTNNYHHHHRSTPSTNSTESNNSPNSITSFDHSRSYHYPQYPTTSGGAHFYRGGSAGAINTGMQVTTNPNNNPGDVTSIQTCFPFNVHSQNAGSSTPLLDSCHHQTLIGYNNNPMAGGMYVKFGQAFTFANVSYLN